MTGRSLKQDLDTQSLVQSGLRLPLIHTTTAYRFRDIIPGDELIPMMCPVFGQRLTYLFYGRPSYKAPDGVNSRLDFNLPIVLIFPPQEVRNIKSIYPFDTGAFSAGIYEGFFHKDTKVDSFELPGELEYADRAVSMFFTSLRNYFFGVADRNVDIDPMNFELQGLQELNRVPSMDMKEYRRRDERSTSIEIQVGAPIKLTNTLHAVITPEVLLDNEEVVKALDRWKPNSIKFYNPKFQLTSQETSGEIYRIVQDIYEDLGVL